MRNNLVQLKKMKNNLNSKITPVKNDSKIREIIGEICDLEESIRNSKIIDMKK